MISFGIDAIEIDRFKNFKNYKEKQLSKIYTKEEIIYCLSNTTKSQERFAARFAAKEAFYKAIFPHLEIPIGFLSSCKNIEIQKNLFGPINFKINWSAFKLKNIVINDISTSITHTKNIAIAAVILDKSII